MPTPKNVQIPYQTFETMLKVCEEAKMLVEIHNINFGYYEDLRDVLQVLEAKRDSLELRQLYGNLIDANKRNDRDRQDDARIEYLKKRGLRDR